MLGDDAVQNAETAAELSPARRRLRRFRVPVLVIALLVVLAATRGLNVLAAGNAFVALVVGLGTAVAALVCYHWLTRTVEARATVTELSRAGRWSGLARGGVLGCGLFTTMILIIGAFGGWEHVGWGSIGGLVASIGAVASIAVNEELLFRGVVFRILDERVGSVIAVLTSSLIFGLTHLVNDHATLWGTIALGIEGGTLTAACYLVSRSLWLPIGLHFAWDFTHIGIFGLPTSSTVGGGETGLLHTTLTGPDLLSGGVFGPEASLVALLLCLVPAFFLLRRAHRTGGLRRRPWAAGDVRQSDELRSAG
ncbi:CPBP family intramembrane glutamic endopeptidase [Actinoplanes sp. NBRC 103695]|uniref:CPBP family intramembrane glutamic endopeptidase n=1 Tax=Actinoplanes sp. NBRC 103695 TaxID=3032202 RepID=UPI0024A3F023|nr:CPBP family intramembrane glutamic endopeptidase [Actinoplanes sp. NBRC 103695]GLY98334.1 CAAX amino protease [Actinoplanes sp. NBRC 103695]